MKPLEKTLRQLAVVVMVLMITIPVKGQWGTNVNDIYNTNTGNVGIGTAGPEELFEIEKSTPVLRISSTYAMENASNTILSKLDFGTHYDARNEARIYMWGDFPTTGYGADLRFATGGGNKPAQPIDRMVIKANGNVGIGTTAPSRKLDVTIIGDGIEGIRIGRVGGLGDPNSWILWNMDADVGAYGDDFEIWQYPQSGGSLQRFEIQDDGDIFIPGNVGIGTASPGSKLTVKDGEICVIRDLDGVFSGYAYSNTNWHNPRLALYRARGTATSPLAVSNGDQLATFDVWAYSPTAGFQRTTGANGLTFHVDGVPSGSTVPSMATIGSVTIKNNGFVGIGTTDFSTTNGNIGKILKIGSANNNVLIGESTSANRYLIFESRLDGRGTSERTAQISLGDDGSNNGHILFHTAPSGSDVAEAMRINQSGNVGIGTTTVTEKLTVKGKILAEEVRVVVSVPDYVFGKEYKLKTLSEVSKYINEHKHLPEVPSEKEVMDNCGQVSLGEMNMTLLKKIEELTLYAIEQDETIKSLLKEVSEIKLSLKRVTELEKQ